MEFTAFYNTFLRIRCSPSYIRDMTFYAHMEPHPFTKGKVWANEISLTPSLFIEVHVPSQESEQTCIFVLVISMLSLSTGLIFYFGIVLKLLYF